jgi:hypothetical protein
MGTFPSPTPLDLSRRPPQHPSILFRAGEIMRTPISIPHSRIRWALALVAIMLAGLIGSAGAQVTAIVTADNAYRIGYGPAAGPATWLPTVENTSAAQIFTCGPGPERYTLNPGVGDYLYIVAYSDKAATQGVLGTFALAGGQMVPTGGAWQVYATNQNVNPGGAGVSPAMANNAIVAANGSNGWRGSVPLNGTVPGLAVGEMNNSAAGDFPITCSTGLTGIWSQARWMWYTSRPPSSAFNTSPGPNGHGEFLIFRLPVRALMCTCPRLRANETSREVDVRNPDIRNAPVDSTARPRR